MGERGRIKKYAEPIQIRFNKGDRTKLQILAEADGITVSDLVRSFVTDGLNRRIVRKNNDVVTAIQDAALALDEALSMLPEKPSTEAKRWRSEGNSPRVQAIIEEYRNMREEDHATQGS